MTRSHQSVFPVGFKFFTSPKSSLVFQCFSRTQTICDNGVFIGADFFAFAGKIYIGCSV